jgi:hypothetical protein
MGDFLREAAVLVCVFGLLEPVLKEGRISFGALVAIIGIAAGLFLLGLLLALQAEAHR